MLGVGHIVGGFRLVRVLGSGGFGTVWEGFDEAAGVPVAIKLLDRMGGASSLVRQQLLAEAEALRSVDSPCTLPVLAVIDEPGVLALVTELVPGVSLRTVLDKHGQLSGLDALIVLRGAALGLAAVHHSGLVHGDVKPANMMIEPSGNSRLIDFGLVSLPGWVAEDSLSPWGSPAYAPPELVAHGFRDTRSDVYSLTVSLFEVLCGRRPFVGDTVDEVRSNHVYQKLPDPRLFVPDLGDGLTQLLLWGLTKDPEQRCPDVVTWLQYLEAAAEQKYGPDWWISANLGAVAGGMMAGGLIASGVLLPTSTGAGIASSGVAGASATGVAATAGGPGASAAGTATVGGGFTSTLIGKAVIGAVAATTLVGGGVIVGNIVKKVASADQVTMVEKIAFHKCDFSTEIMDCSIHTINPDGTGEVKLLDGFSPTWSPDGTQLAFFHETELRSASLYVTDIENGLPVGSPRKITSEKIDTAHDITWTPDQKSLIVFAGAERFSWVQSFVLEENEESKASDDFLQGSAEWHLVGGLPSWSPDGSRLAAIFGNLNSPEGEFKIGIANADGTDPELLNNTNSSHWEPVWSPDGKTIVFTERNEDDSTSTLWESSPDGTNQHKLWKKSGWGFWAKDWSPDSSKILINDRSIWDDSKLVILDVATGNTTELVVGLGGSWGLTPIVKEKPTVKADTSGKTEKIAFTRCGGDGEDDEENFSCSIYTVNSDGTDEVRLVEGDDPAWSPDGSQLAFADSEDIIHIVNIKDGKPVGQPRPAIPDQPEPLRMPRWIPGEEAIAAESYSLDSGGTTMWKLSLIDGPGGQTMREMTGYEMGSSIYWSPDGTQTIGNGTEGRFSKYLMLGDANGLNSKLIADSDDGHSWSHDGEHIAYAENTDGISGIWITDIEQTDQRVLFELDTSDDQWARSPVWSPDSMKLLFNHQYTDYTSIWVIDITSGDAEELVSDGRSPTWAWVS